MFIRAKKHPNTDKTTVLICHSKRSGKKVRQVILKRIGCSSREEEIIKLQKIAQYELALLKKQPMTDRFTETNSLIKLSDLKEVNRSHVGIKDIFGKLFNELGFHTILTEKDSDNLKLLIAARITEPSSKLRASEILQKKFGLDLSVDSIYRLLDKLQENSKLFEEKVFEATKEVSGGSVDLLLFDVTTLSFETIEKDELRNFGFSKDHKFNTTQVVLALATNKEGLPIGYKLFPGNTAEVKTLIACINSWKEYLKIGQVIFVADRGLMSKDNIKLLEDNGMLYIVACPLRKLSEQTKELIFDKNNYGLREIDDKTISWIKELEVGKNSRLIVSYNSKRHSKDKKDRETLIAKIEKKLGKQPKAKKLVSNKGYIKYTSIADECIAVLNEKKVHEDEKWDGLHGVLTNADLDSAEILRRYKNLWVIEESFRINKHNLEMRPIYHHTPKRIQSHILLCFLTFALLRQAHHKLKTSDVNISIEDLREELIDVQASVLCNSRTGELFKMPSAVTENVKDIYNTFNVPLGGAIQNYI